MWAMTTLTVTREDVWRACRRAHDGRQRERAHGIVRLMAGKSWPAMAPWLYRDEEPIRRWVHAFNLAGLRGWERAPRPGRPA